MINLISLIKSAQAAEPLPTIKASGVEVVTLQAFEIIFSNILSIITTLAGLTAFAMFILAGFKYLMSQGDPKQTELAKNQMTYAIIGLVVIIGAYLILKFLADFTGINLLQFDIPG